MRNMRRFFGDIGGAAAVEFALIAPVMVAMYFGMAELTQGLLANRRVGHVTAAVGDLVAQYPVLTESQVTDIFSITTSLMAPMSSANLAIRVTSISIDEDENATVTWSRAQGPTSSTIPALADDAAVNDIPADLKNANEALVRADTEYVYTSPLGDIMPNPITFKHTIYLKPRSDVPVAITD